MQIKAKKDDRRGTLHVDMGWQPASVDGRCHWQSWQDFFPPEEKKGEQDLVLSRCTNTIRTCTTDFDSIN